MKFFNSESDRISGFALRRSVAKEKNFSFASLALPNRQSTLACARRSLVLTRQTHKKKAPPLRVRLFSWRARLDGCYRNFRSLRNKNDLRSLLFLPFALPNRRLRSASHCYRRFKPIRNQTRLNPQLSLGV